MGERCNSKVGHEVAFGDCLCIDGTTKIRVHGFVHDNYDLNTRTGKRIASVTYDNGSILKDYEILPQEWYQLC